MEQNQKKRKLTLKIKIKKQNVQGKGLHPSFESSTL
jgi:hypothetical protein